MPDLNKLKGIMVEKGKTYVDGARIIGCSVTSFSAKMNGKSSFTVLEAICTTYLPIITDKICNL